MTTEGKGIIKKYWREILTGAVLQLLLVFLGNYGAQKVYDWRLGTLEIKVTEIETELKNDIKPNVDILSWMHDIGIRGKEPDNSKHKHKL